MARADCIIAGWLYGWQDGRVFLADHETFGGIRGTSPKPAPVIGRVQGWGVVIPRSMPPRSFHYDRIGAWEAWVLEQHYRHQVRPTVDGHLAAMAELF